MLISYFHTLEFILRAVLKNSENGKLNINYASLKRGQILPEDSMTNYDSLGDLIRKYNKLVPENLRIAKEIVEIRDALAHGRVFSDSQSLPMRLFKFSKPMDGMVTVTFAVTLNRKWFKETTHQVYNEIEKALQTNEQYESKQL